MYSHLAKSFAEVAADDIERVNRRKLASCFGHFFDSKGINWKRKTAPETLRCVMCGGHMPFEEARQYATGIAHGGGNLETVMEGFGR